MIPYILAAVGGWLIGSSTKDKAMFEDGGNVMSKYRITIMSVDFDLSYEDNHQKYGFTLMANDENDAIKKGKEMFMKEYSGHPIESIKAFKID